MSPAHFQPTGMAARIGLLLALLFGMAGEPVAEQLPIKVYTTADGLVRDSINRIVRDSRGFLWFATFEGLSRFDGYRFTNYTTADGLPDRRIRDVLETRGGVYWIATGDGVVRLNPRGSSPNAVRRRADGSAPAPLFTVYHPSEDLAARSIYILREDHTGTIWCGTGGGLYKLEQMGEQVRFQFVDAGMPTETADDSMVEQVLEDRRGALWVGTRGSGLYRRWMDGRVERYTTRQGLLSDRINALLEDRDGRLWAGTSSGLCLLVPEPEPNQSIVARAFTTKDGLPAVWVNALLQSSDGKLWVGTSSGLGELMPTANQDAQKFRGYTIAQGLSHQEINALGEDPGGNIWMGTVFGGAMKLAHSGFVTYRGEADGLSVPYAVSAIFQNRAGELCLDERGTLRRYNGQRFTATRLNLPKHITYFGWGVGQLTLQDREGEWWVPTGQGLCRFPKTSRVEQLALMRPKAVYTTRDGLIDDNVYRLFEDSRGDIWIISFSLVRFGVTRWERATGIFHAYTEAGGRAFLPSAAASFGEDASGNVWIGHGETLTRYGAGSFEVFTAADGLPSGGVLALYRDRAGRLWIATGAGGVGRVDDPAAARPVFVTYTMADGLSSNQILSAITEDQWGNIYIGTGRGVDRLDPETGKIRHYTTADGLAGSQAEVALRDHQGALWFSTAQGLSRLIPEQSSPQSPPPVFISRLRVAGELYPISELGETDVSEVALGPGENNLQIDFVALSFAAGGSLRYQYKLEGSSEDWSASTDQRTVNFANLAAGSYRFLVRAVDSDGTFSQTPASIAFTVQPPFWQRWWFMMLAALLVASGVFAFDRYRVARLKELDAALTESQELTEQLTRQRAELRRANRSLSLEAAVTAIISDSATLNDAAPKILQAVCELAQWKAGKLWELEPQTRALRCVAAWRLETQEAEGDQPRGQHTANLPGAERAYGALENGQPALMTDHETEAESTPADSTADSTRAYGFPILLGHEVLGILELFSPATQEHDAELFEMMSTIGSQIGQLLDRKHAEEALRKSREERLAELERVRRRIATDLHDDIGSSLTQISILSEVAYQHAGRGDKQGQEPLARVIKVSNELVDAMSDIVWAINPKKDHLSDLLQRMRRFASDIFTARNIAFVFHAPGADKNLELGANLRREIFLVFKETVNNVVKHSGCSRAEIEFKVDGDWLILSVRDDGEGFDVAAAAVASADNTTRWKGGNGIASMRKRAAEMSGEFVIVSSKGEGTTSTLRVPANR